MMSLSMKDAQIFSNALKKKQKETASDTGNLCRAFGSFCIL